MRSPPLSPADPNLPLAGLGLGGREAKAPFARAVFVCGKCARRLDDRGFGADGRKSLRKALKRAAKNGGWKADGKVRIVESACLGLCPKRRQVVATGEMVERRRLLVVEPGTPGEAVLTRLLGAPTNPG